MVSDPPGTGVTGGCKLPDAGAGNRTQNPGPLQEQ